MKSLQQQLQEAYLGMKGILSEEDEEIVEEILALDELSKKTLGSYIKKASKQARSDGHMSGYELGSGARKRGEESEYRKSSDKRLKGITKATDRLTKEEFEETLDEMLDLLDEEAITELSKKTLGSYIKKSAKDMSQNKFQHGYGVGKTISRDDPDYGDKVKHKAAKRLSGIVKATSRLTKEQKELISNILDELVEEVESE